MGEGPLKNVKGILFGKQAQKLEDALEETGDTGLTGLTKSTVFRHDLTKRSR